MSKEASRIRRVISRLTNREDVAEILTLARIETAVAIFSGDGKKFDRAVAIADAAKEALDARSVLLQTTLPDSCLRSSAAAADAIG
jgi:hypothetical protein